MNVNSTSTTENFDAVYTAMAIKVSQLTYSLAESRLGDLMRQVLKKPSSNKRALNRTQELIAQLKTELTHGKRQVVLFDMLEELEIEISRL